MQCSFCHNFRDLDKIYCCRVCGKDYCLTEGCDAAHTAHCKLSASLGANNRGIRCDFCGERWADNQNGQLQRCRQCNSLLCTKEQCTGHHMSVCEMLTKEQLTRTRQAANLLEINEGTSVFICAHVELDNIASRALDIEIDKHLSKDCTLVILDLSKVVYMSSNAIGVLNKHRRARKDIGQIMRFIFKPNSIPEKFLLMVGLRSFECYANLEDAENANNRLAKIGQIHKPTE